MVFDFKFPDVGEGIVEGEIVKWLVKVGDVVKEDDVLGQVETDKAVVDIPSPHGGKILKLHVAEGAVVKVGQVMVSIGGDGDKVTKSKSSVKSSPSVAAKSKSSLNTSEGGKNNGDGKSGVKGAAVVGEIEVAKDGDVVLPTPVSHAVAGEKQSVKVLASPVVRKLAAQKNIDLTSIKGSGPKGRITSKDLSAAHPAVESEVPQSKIVVKKKFDDFGFIEHVPLKGVRKIIGDHMLESVKMAPQVTSMEDIDVSKLWDLRKREKPRLAKQKIKLTFLPFIIKATIAALKENPSLNASIVDNEILLKKYYNIGVATETEVGLMVPVVKIAQDKTIPQLAKEIDDLSTKARDRKIDVMDLKGGSFTITNYGSVGGTYGTPIINYPESAILGLGRIFDRVVPDGKNKTKVIKVLPVSLTFDHRIADGANAARFLQSLKMFLEDPSHMLLALK